MSDASAPASLIGLPAGELDTPALVVDLDAMDRNIDRISSYLKRAGVAWRPHTKGSKVPAIAHRLLRAGAIGVTCAKVSEAEVMAAAGVPEILIANQVVGPVKVARLVALCRWARVLVAVDHVRAARELGAAARRAGVTVDVLVEVNMGLNRAGVEPGAPGIELARALHATDGLRLRGVTGWEGQTQLIADAAEKERAIGAAVHALVSTADAARAANLPIEVVSCGGTGTYRYTALQPGVTEIQAGGGIFGDLFYRAAGAEAEFALTLLSTVTSRPSSHRIVTDAGRKSMTGDMGLPQPQGVEGVKKVRLSAEHCTIELEEPTTSLDVGEKLSFVLGYEDTTVCLHDYLYGARNGRVEVVWPIAGRGKLQ